MDSTYSNNVYSRYVEIETTARKAVKEAKGYAPEDLLVIAIHPTVVDLITEWLGLDNSSHLEGIAGVTNVVVTDSVDGLRVVVWPTST